MSSVRAIVAGHGDFARGLLSAVEQISGRADDFVGVSNTGLGARDVERTLREAVESSGAGVIFTDLPAGSCTMAARRLQREHPHLVVVMGANLPALLDFVYADDLPAAGAARHATERGRASLVSTGGPAADAGGTTRGD